MKIKEHQTLREKEAGGKQGDGDRKGLQNKKEKKQREENQAGPLLPGAEKKPLLPPGLPRSCYLYNWRIRAASFSLLERYTQTDTHRNTQQSHTERQTQMKGKTDKDSRRPMTERN